MREADLIHDWNVVGQSFDWAGARFALNDETLRDGLQSPSVRSPSIEQKIGILRIAFGAARGKRFAKAIQCGGIDRVQDQEVMLQQGMDQAPPSLLQADPDVLTAEAATQPGQPLGERLRSGLDPAAFDVLGASLP